MSLLQKFGLSAAVVSVLALGFACGSDSDDDKDSSTVTTLTWDKDIAPIVAKDCTGSGCHGSANPGSTVYEDNEKNFKDAKTQVVARLNLAVGSAGFMPQGVASYEAARKQKLIDFVNQ